MTGVPCTFLSVLELCRMLAEAGTEHGVCEGRQEQAALTAEEEAGLAAAVAALHQHTALLEGQGVLQATAPNSCWLQPGSQRGVAGIGGPPTQSFVAWPQALLPAYLAGGQQQGATEHGSYEHWPAWQGPACTDACDAIQDADEGEPG